MPDVSYTIYRQSTQTTNGNAETVVLVRLGVEQAANPRSAVRQWFKTVNSAVADEIVGETIVVIPTRNHHPLAPEVETQPRLVFS